MEFFLNELSIHGQFENVPSFWLSLAEILKCKDIVVNSGHIFYCDTMISGRCIFDQITFQTAILQTTDRNLISSVMAWISKGPFGDDPMLQEHAFKYGGNEITQSSLGKAAFRIAQKQTSRIVSFRPSNFLSTPLQVVWFYRKKSPVNIISVPNLWDFQTFVAYLKQQEPPITSWVRLLDKAKMDFANLTFLDDLIECLEGEPYNSSVGDRIIHLLGVLSQLKASFDENGDLTKTGNDILDNYFRREDAVFSDESDSNKKNFEKELTFKKPNGESIFCPFHGKIRHRVFRLHFSWPVKHDEPLYIVYIGPKLTKQ